MDPNAPPAPGLISSLEAMIQISVASILDRRLGPTADALDARSQAAVAAAIDKRLGPALGSLGNRMNSLIEQRLADAVRTLNQRVSSSVAAALEQRLGPAGSALTAQITFTAPFAAVPSEPKAQILGEVIGKATREKEENRSLPAEVGATIQQMRDDGPTERARLPMKQGPAGQISQAPSDLVDEKLNCPLTTAAFTRKEADRKAKNFVIEKCIESYGVLVKASSVNFTLGRTELMA